MTGEQQYCVLQFALAVLQCTFSGIAGHDRRGTMVIDEIDSNVGGRLGSVIGHKLRSLAASHQVLCITHLPQIAALGDRHFQVAKALRGDRTITEVTALAGDAQIDELGQMLGGSVTAASRANARELLARAADWKRSHAAPGSAPARSKTPSAP